MSRFILVSCAICSTQFHKSKAELGRHPLSYCSKECLRESRRVTKEEYADRILTFYFETGKVPTIEDFKNSQTHRRLFGTWRNAIEYCGLTDVKVVKKVATKPNANNWSRQRDRHIATKMELISTRGSKCAVCGYGKNLSALHIHHIDPTTKSLSLDARSLGNVSMKRILAEFEKCTVLCANCHAELHNPDLEMVRVAGVAPAICLL